MKKQTSNTSWDKLSFFQRIALLWKNRETLKKIANMDTGGPMQNAFHVGLEEAPY